MLERNKYISRGNDEHLDFELALDGEVVHDLHDLQRLDFYLIDMDRETVLTKVYNPAGDDIEINTPTHGSVRVHLRALDTEALEEALYRMTIRAWWDRGMRIFTFEWNIDSVLYVKPSASLA